MAEPIARARRTQLAETVRGWLAGIALPPGWHLASLEAEQGIALGFRGPRGRLVVELDVRDEARGCYAHTDRLNVYYSRVDRLRRDLDADEHVIMRAVLGRVAAHEHELPPPPPADPDPHRVHVRELTADHALVMEGPGSYYLNPYVGCLLACPYCYAMHRADASRLLSGDPVVPWGKWVDVKVDLPEVLARELPVHEPGVVRMSPIVTDPYQPIERRYRVTRRCLDALAGTAFVPMILTRSAIVLDDLDRLAAFPRTLVGMSIPTDDDAMRSVFEPKTPSIEDRLEALRKLHGAGLCTFVVIQPMLPMDPLRLVEAVAPFVHAVRIAPMYEKDRAAPLYRAVDRVDASTDTWERATFEQLRAGFEARGLPVTTGEDLPALLPTRNADRGQPSS